MSERPPSLIVVSAPSGAGKSTVLARVMAQMEGIRFSVSHTTRAPRPGETDGVQYHFVDRRTFEDMRHRELFLEWASVHDNLYGTARAEYERAQREGVDLLLDLDVQGAAQVRMKFDDATSIFILPPSYEALEARLRGRGLDEEATISRRLQGAREEAGLYREYDHVVINDDFDACVEAVESVIRAARCRASRMEAAALRILETFARKKEN